MKNVIKILTALATVAGAVYIIATYGEQIVAWAKKLLDAMPKCPTCKKDDEAEVIIDVTEEPAAPEEAAEPAAEEAAQSEEIVDEPAPEVVVAEHEPVAEEADFAE